MQGLDLKGLPPIIADRITPFFSEILKQHSNNIHSINIVGSAVTPDFNEKTSDINSLIILNEMDLNFIRFLSSIGKKYIKKKIASPLVMTNQYIEESLDVFPIEFHDFRLIHQTITGVDILSGLNINNEHLRLQCEREAKIKFISLRQGYISSLGDKELIISLLIKSFTGCIPLFRAIIFLSGKEPPVIRSHVIKTIQEITSPQSDVFEKLLLLRNRLLKPSIEELEQIFEQYYMVLEKTGFLVDSLQAS